jgi:hypothetical protein
MTAVPQMAAGGADPARKSSPRLIGQIKNIRFTYQ